MNKKVFGVALFEKKNEFRNCLVHFKCKCKNVSIISLFWHFTFKGKQMIALFMQNNKPNVCSYTEVGFLYNVKKHGSSQDVQPLSIKVEFKPASCCLVFFYALLCFCSDSLLPIPLEVFRSALLWNKRKRWWLDCKSRNKCASSGASSDARAWKSGLFTS